MATEYEVVNGMLCEWTDHCTCGSPVNQGFPHERGCGLEPLAPVAQMLADLESAEQGTAPDSTTTTETRVEWRVSATTPRLADVEYVHATQRLAQNHAAHLNDWGWPSVCVESRTVTVHATGWKAER